MYFNPQQLTPQMPWILYLEPFFSPGDTAVTLQLSRPAYLSIGACVLSPPAEREPRVLDAPSDIPFPPLLHLLLRLSESMFARSEGSLPHSPPKRADALNLLKCPRALPVVSMLPSFAPFLSLPFPPPPPPPPPPPVLV